MPQHDRLNASDSEIGLYHSNHDAIMDLIDPLSPENGSVKREIGQPPLSGWYRCGTSAIIKNRGLPNELSSKISRQEWGQLINDLQDANDQRSFATEIEGLCMSCCCLGLPLALCCYKAHQKANDLEYAIAKLNKYLFVPRKMLLKWRTHHDGVFDILGRTEWLEFAYTKKGVERLNNIPSHTYTDNRKLKCCCLIYEGKPVDQRMIKESDYAKFWENPPKELNMNYSEVLEQKAHAELVQTYPQIRAEEHQVISIANDIAKNGVTKEWFAISNDWLNEWKEFIKGSNERPNKIDNTILLNKNGKVKKGLEAGNNYRMLEPPVWNAFVKLYGGGPEISRKSGNIYKD